MIPARSDEKSRPAEGTASAGLWERAYIRGVQEIHEERKTAHGLLRDAGGNGAGGLCVAIAAEAGSQGDPLVTLSYLNDTFLGQLLGKVDEKIAQRDQEILREVEKSVDAATEEVLDAVDGADTAGNASAAVYQEVTLSAGQVLYGSAGCEVMLRGGSATCVSAGKSTPGLVDITGGGTINDGTALQTNHLYTMTADRGVKAADAVTLLVRGSYTIG